MNCSEFEIHLDEQMASSRLVETPDLARHAAQCDHCRTRLEQYHRLGDALELWRNEIPDVDLAREVVAARRVSQSEFFGPAEPAGPTAAPRRRTNASRALAPAQHAGTTSRPMRRLFRISRTLGLAAGCLAAGVVAAILISRLGNDRPGDNSHPQIAANPVPKGPVSKGVVPTAEKEGDSQRAAPVAARDPLPASQNAVYHEFAQKAAGALFDVSAFVTSGAVSESADPASGTEDRQGWMDGLEQQLQPIGRGLDDAFDFLWQAGQSADRTQS